MTSPAMGNPSALWLLLLVPLLWTGLFFFNRGKRPRHRLVLQGALKTVLILLAALALADIRAIKPGAGVDLIFARDLSLSTGMPAEAPVTGFIQKTMDRAGSSARAGLVAFGRQAYVEQDPAPGFRPGTIQTLPDKTRTDIGNAVRSAAGRFSPGRTRHIILFTDGNENAGSARDAARLAGSLGIRIWPVPLDTGFSGDEVIIEKMESPRQIPIRTPYRIRVKVSATGPAQGRLLVMRNREQLADIPVDLKPGKNSFSLEDAADTPGIRVYKAVINSPDDTLFENNTFFCATTGLAPARLLYISHTARTLFADALAVQGMAVDVRQPSGVAGDRAALLQYRALVIDNVPAQAFSPKAMANIRSFVRDAGGGLVMVGGDRGFGAGGWRGTPVEAILPVTSEHPATLENPEFCLVLLMDTSASMGGYPAEFTKLDGVKAAAFSVVELLKPFDRIGLLAFDMEPYWALPIARAGRREKIAAQLTGLSAVGGTHLFPALSLAYETLAKVTASKKHMIILSDGKTQRADFHALILAMADQDITISTVAVGKKSDRVLMKNLADWGGGRFYYTEDPARIPRIFTTDTRIASGQAIVEAPLPTRLEDPLPFLAGIPTDRLPESRGLVRTYPRPGASVVFDTPKGPLLAARQYGLGRSIAFTSAFDGKWGQEWVQWPHFQRLASQMARWVQKDDPGSFYRVDLARQQGTGLFAVDVTDPEGNFVNQAALKLNLVSPAGDTRTLPLGQTAPGRYAARFPANETGEYYLTLYEDSPAARLPSRTFFMGVPYSDEFRTRGVNRTLLADMARITGGKVLELDDDPAPIFDTPGEKGQQGNLNRGKALWPWFVLAFALIFVLDAAVRQFTE